MNLKENLIKLMKIKGLTIRELADKTEISEPTLKRLRSRDDANPTLDVLIKISTALDVPLSTLIEEKERSLLIYQGQNFSIPPDTSEFIFVFTKDTFSFPKGTKAVFKKYYYGDPITKYILDKKGGIFEKINGEKCLFRDEEFNNYSIDKDLILAYIVKELYEVNYV